MRKRVLRILTALAMLFCLALGGDVYEKTKQANQFWHQGKYKQALAKYMEASTLAKENEQALLHFNMGCAYYKQSEYQKAIFEFEKALTSDKDELREKAFYNLGNCYFRLGIQNKNIELLKKSALNYRRALEINPDDQDAKYNLEVVRRHIQLLKKPKPPCSSCKSGGEKKEQEEQKKSSPQSAQAKKSQKEQEKKQSKQASAKPAQEKQRQKGASAKQPKTLSKEEAEMILKALSEKEKEAMKELVKAKATYVPKGKDW